MNDALLDRPTPVDGLEVEQLADGLVVYQPWPERLHHLNRTAAVVFTLCSGSDTIADIAAEVGRAFGLTEPPVDDVATCVDELRNLGLLLG